MISISLASSLDDASPLGVSVFFIDGTSVLLDMQRGAIVLDVKRELQRRHGIASDQIRIVDMASQSQLADLKLVVECQAASNEAVNLQIVKVPVQALILYGKFGSGAIKHFDLATEACTELCGLGRNYFTLAAAPNLIVSQMNSFQIESDADSHSLKLNGGLFAVGGDGRGHTSNLVEMYSVEMFHQQQRFPSWKRLPNMTMHRACCAAVVSHGTLFAFGGYGRSASRPISCVESFDLVRNPRNTRWKIEPSMQECRASCAAAVLNGFVYVAGGRDADRKPVASAERFCLTTRTWESLPALMVTCGECTAAVLNGHFYVVGSSQTSDSQAFVEEFIPEIGRWECLPPMLQSRRSCYIAAINGQLFVGNCDSVESFDLERGTWEPASSELAGPFTEVIAL